MNESTGEATRAEVARRAYEISERADAGTPEENWLRAERELSEDGVEPSAPKRGPARTTESPVGSS